eukprot:GHVU01072731.1.p1 GENE.GHVU01072731.1~~GHVU01072731.1.p1  ORF type:complete len:102 (+),score=6.03 GHVU01072731.1:279-584(+)
MTESKLSERFGVSSVKNLRRERSNNTSPFAGETQQKPYAFPRPETQFPTELAPRRDRLLIRPGPPSSDPDQALDPANTRRGEPPTAVAQNILGLPCCFVFA